MPYGPLIIDLQGPSLTALEMELIRHPLVGGVLLFTRNFIDLAQLKQLVEKIRHIAPEILLMVDHEGGSVWRFHKDFSKLPPMQTFYQIDKTDSALAAKLLYNAGLVMAQELLLAGIDLSLAPVLDIDYGISKVIGSRALASDPTTVARLALNFINGMHAAGMATTGKHFPGHGAVALDTHLEQVIDTRNSKELMQDALLFKQLAGQLEAIMPAHVIYPAVDSYPAGFSKIWLQDILRTTFNFQGAIISDCISMQAAKLAPSQELITMALNAGCDMVIVAMHSREDLQQLLANNYPINQASVARIKALQGKFQQARAMPQTALLADITVLA